jgi:hypothetical protein
MHFSCDRLVGRVSVEGLVLAVLCGSNSFAFLIPMGRSPLESMQGCFQGKENEKLNFEGKQNKFPTMKTSTDKGGTNLSKEPKFTWWGCKLDCGLRITVKKGSILRDSGEKSHMMPWSHNADSGQLATQIRHIRNKKGFTWWDCKLDCSLRKRLSKMQ